MTNWKLLTGCFVGSVVAESCPILDVDFKNLDDDLQARIRDWAKNNKEYITINDGADFAKCGENMSPPTMNDIKKDYEESWDAEETDEEVDLIPLSEW